MNPFQNSFGGHIPQDVAGKQGENVIFIVYNLTDSPDTVDKVKDVCANFSAMIRSMRNRFPDMQFSCTMGFGADAWTRLFPDKGKPKELSTFSEIKGEKYTAVSTPGDLLFHIRAKQMGLCFEFASILDEKLKGLWCLLMRRMDFAIWMVRRLSALWTVRRILLSMRIPIILR